MDRIIVTGAGGFLGLHLVRRLKEEGHFVLGIDRRLPEFQASVADDYCVSDLRSEVAASNCFARIGRVDKVFHLAADTGGCAYRETNQATRLRNNALIHANVLLASHRANVGRLLFTSSSGVYNAGRNILRPFTEEDAWPAGDQDLCSLLGEKLCETHRQQFGLRACVVRLSGVYGPWAAYEGDKARAPMAACCKVARAVKDEPVVVWGDGSQLRTFMYVNDCVEGLVQAIASDHQEPINLASTEIVSIAQLFNIVAIIAGRQIVFEYDRSQPQGVWHSYCNTERAKTILGWEPESKLVDGLIPTYEWVRSQCL